MTEPSCTYAEICSGCSEWKKPYPDQLAEKKSHLEKQLREINVEHPAAEVISIEPYGFRDWMDLTIEDGRIGLYSHQIQFIVDLPKCMQMSPKLAEFYQEVRKIPLPIHKGSIRLRISPTGEKGIWLDFANLDIKKLLEEKTSLLALLKIAHVEIGQRKKVLTLQKEQLKLEDPQLKHWSRTWSQDREIPLSGTVSTFTQSGDLANQQIIQHIRALCSTPANMKKIIEYGAGNGNLTFSFLNAGHELLVLETDPFARKAFEKTLQEISIKPKVKFLEQAQLNESHLKKTDLLLANPPRSGLSTLLGKLQELAKTTHLPLYFVYMSCSYESFLKDAVQMQYLGYELTVLKIVDQFPQTKHYEIISKWVKKI